MAYLKNMPPRLNLNDEDSLPRSSGTYALLLSLIGDRELPIGMLGEQSFAAGHYAYIGSAHGPGGLAGRIGRHLRTAAEKPLHWHIDHFLRAAPIQQVWWMQSELKLECCWAQILADAGFNRSAGFGATDCHCGGHLLRLGEEAGVRKAWAGLQSKMDGRIRQIQFTSERKED